MVSGGYVKVILLGPLSRSWSIKLCSLYIKHRIRSMKVQILLIPQKRTIFVGLRVKGYQGMSIGL